MRKTLQQLLKIIFSILWIWVLLSILLNINLDYASKQPTNILLCLGLAALIILGFRSIKNVNFELNTKKKIILFIIVLIIQIMLFNSILFETGWDSLSIIRDAILIRENAIELIPFDYYSIYPNNILICIVYYWVFALLKMFNLVNGKPLLLTITIINSIISNLSCLMVYSLLKRKTNNKYALFGYIFALLLIAFSPWNLIPYSDQLAIIIPIAIYYVYDSKCNLYTKYILMAILGFVGYHLKPQSIIILIAIIIINIMYVNKDKVKKIAKPLCLSLIIFIICTVCFNQYTKSLGFIKDKNKQFEVTHYIKMGLNKETYGAFNDNDVNVSMYCENRGERIRYNSLIIKERLNDFGLINYFDFLSKKLCITFSDGIFSWGKEGNFYNEDYSSKSYVSSLLKDFYYNDGKYFIVYSTIQTTCWFVMLISMAIQIFNKSDSKEQLILKLTTIGIILFQLLFETRARYLLSNVLLIIVIAMMGLYSSKLYNNCDGKNK